MPEDALRIIVLASLLVGCRHSAGVERDFQSNFSALDGVQGRLVVEIGSWVLQRLFRTISCSGSALHVDILGALGGLRQDGDFVGQNLGESPGDGEMLSLAALLVGDFADGQLGDERRVSGQNTDVASLAGNLHLVGRLVHQQTFRSDDLELNRVSHTGYAVAFIFSAASSTSSMPPLRKNACSGMSSCLPSTISWKLRTVSSTFTYLPLTPVNCSATWKGCEKKRWILRARETVSFWSSLSSSIPRMAMMSCKSLYPCRICLTSCAVL